MLLGSPTVTYNLEMQITLDVAILLWVVKYSESNAATSSLNRLYLSSLSLNPITTASDSSNLQGFSSSFKFLELGLT